ncbi:helicase c2 [Klebsiella aerogenes]|nr:helicase c2 [Klebsiella aerogenes]
MIDDFAADGQLAMAIPGFKPREPQRQMAIAVSEAIDASRPLVVEAGTGTGKTYAYLAPRCARRKR